MIQIDPEAALEILDARDYYEAERPGLGRNFLLAADGLLDVIERDWMAFPLHPFARIPDVRRAHFPRPWPYAFAFLVRGQEPPRARVRALEADAHVLGDENEIALTDRRGDRKLEVTNCDFKLVVVGGAAYPFTRS